jgi:hypothetical protein
MRRPRAWTNLDHFLMAAARDFDISDAEWRVILYGCWSECPRTAATLVNQRSDVQGGEVDA